jgi:ectoine hydroxylase
MNNAFAENIRNDLYPSRTGKTTRILDRIDPVVNNRNIIGQYSLDTEQLEQYESDGFLLIRNYIPKEIIHELTDELGRLSADETIRELDNVISEPDNNEVRSLFNLPQMSHMFDKISRSRQLLDIVMQLLGGPVYLHQSRINIKPAFRGKSFPWHSDFETWHVEDGLPRIRCLSCSIFLTENNPYNGPLFVIPRSHKYYISCAGETPENHFRVSLKKQYYGSPDESALGQLLAGKQINGCFGEPGDLLIFDGNIMHGSPDNISNMPRTNLFLAYNSCENPPQEPFCGMKRRPVFLANTDCSPLEII